jgi:hypothetical protein
MADSYSLTSKSYDGRYLKLTCTQTQNISANTSTIKWTLTAAGGNSSYYSTGATTVKIAGKTVYSKSRVDWDEKVFPAAKGSVSGSLTVSHGTTGTKSVSVSLSTAIYTMSVTTKSGTWTLDSIPRKATITSAPNFNDESNPVLKYSNPAGSSVSSLQACIADTSGNIIVAYRDISKSSTSYTFSFTDAERTALRKKCVSANSMTVRFYVKTVIGGETYRNYVGKTLSIINATPTLSPTIVDSDSKMITLTGDSSKLVKYFSDAEFTIGAATLKNATVSSKSCVNNGTTKTADGTFSNVTSNSFKFSVKDSRGNTVSKTLTPTMVNYVKLTCNTKTLRVSTDGVMDFTLGGNYFNGSFGSVSNTITIQYRYKPDGGTYSDWQTITATVSNNTYTASGTVSGLDYKTTYVFQARAADAIYDGTYQSRVSTNEKRVSAKPIFDWSSEDFAINVPVSMFILKSPNGTNYQVTIDDSGGLVTTVITT